ncbi:hypothetical protein O181_114067 [Austropuccinia psidii MF-1]|uniref:Uncharacterized protein n=1 Tax=Austropuccinia psidii MF-1 TaxID=1389203 RepID=A0A9Q3K6V2_9BASI|nr:hypothetical protein [Austropuccinia psidii MF-1]
MNENLKPQENHIIQEGNINSTSKPEPYEELNKNLKNFIVNQTKNGNDYGQETAKKECKKPNIKDNKDESKSVLPQEVIRSPVGFSKKSQPKDSLKKGK